MVISGEHYIDGLEAWGVRYILVWDGIAPNQKVGPMMF